MYIGRDLDLFNELIIITISEGILIGDYNQESLKISSNWDFIDTPEFTYQYFQNEESIIVRGYNSIWMYNNGWDEIELNYSTQVYNNYQILDIIEKNEKKFVLSTKEVIGIGENSFQFSIPINSEFTCIDINENNIVLGLKNHGILVYNMNNDNFNQIINILPG